MRQSSMITLAIDDRERRSALPDALLAIEAFDMDFRRLPAGDHLPDSLDTGPPSLDELGFHSNPKTPLLQREPASCSSASLARTTAVMAACGNGPCPCGNAAARLRTTNPCSAIAASWRGAIYSGFCGRSMRER